MINPGYMISTKDVQELTEFKRSEAYSTYLKSIASSPAYISIMDEHINNVDITDDVTRLKAEKKLPTDISAKYISALFKQTLARMAIGILADSIILKELEDCKIDEVLNNIKSDSDIIYLLGQADKKFYIQAAKLVDEGKLEKDSLAFRGLMAYTKNTEDFKRFRETCRSTIQEKIEPIILDTVDEVKGTKKSPRIDFNQDKIRL